MRPIRPLVAGMLLALLAGCTGDLPAGEPPASPTATPAPPQWGPPLSYEEAFERIPLGGNDRVPIHWEVPEVADEQVAEAVLAAQRFRSLDYHRVSQETPDADAYLYQWVATERMIQIHYPGYPEFPDGPPDPDRPGLGASAGPVWIRVLAAERPWAGFVFVHACNDIGWNGGSNTDLPRVNRASLETLWVKLIRPEQGEPRWKVNGVNPNSRSVVGPELAQECDEWATHEPAEP